MKAVFGTTGIHGLNGRCVFKLFPSLEVSLSINALCWTYSLVSWRHSISSKKALLMLCWRSLLNPNYSNLQVWNMDLKPLIQEWNLKLYLNIICYYSELLNFSILLVKYSIYDAWPQASGTFSLDLDFTMALPATNFHIAYYPAYKHIAYKMVDLWWKCNMVIFV